MWRVSLLDCAQAYEQSVHLYGFSPVCERRCTVRLLQFLNTLPQYSQVSLRFERGGVDVTSACVLPLCTAVGEEGAIGAITMVETGGF